jgi:hypothetical protein
MRRRLLLLVLLSGGLATAGGAALGDAATSGRDTHAPATAFARAELADVPTPALSRVRDALGREHDARRDVTAALGVALVLTLAGGWWLARDRAARARHARPLTIRRTRAPPGMPATVRCC